MSTTNPAPRTAAADGRDPIVIDAPTGKALRKPILAGTVGNFIEQFDYGIYGYLAPYMAASFFPAEDRTAALLSVYAGFALSFLLRPFGGMIFGRYGDRLGRRNALAVAIISMGLLTTLIGVLPPYAAVGFAAPVMLLLIRAAQGLVQGGEYAGAVAFIVEYAPAKKRGLYTSFLSVSVFAGLLTGAGIAALVAASLSDADMEAWGWRIPFLITLPLTLVGLILRLRIDETPEFRRMQEEQKAAAAAGVAEEVITKRPLTEALKTQWKPILIFAGFAITNAVLSFTWVTFLPGYLRNNLGMAKEQALASNFIALGVLLPLLVVSGIMVDKIGRKPMLIMACVSAIVLVPVAFAVVQAGTFAAALTAQFIYLIPIMFISVALTVSMAELFPTKVRYSASAMAYNLAFGIFGGTAPLVATFLLSSTGSIWAVAAYVCAVAVVSLICVIKAFRETRGTRLSDSKYT
ncbi:MFS transporter [Arthrobacter sp. 18067]|uniref:MFS transporter n=1 Tax=Arthrobacter sp. 18067 TaxID=2681413 RepID=UPI00190F4EAF|nr:MFS transporter [Arthrobacter sp. 18067]